MCCKFCLAAESAERKVEEARPDDKKFDTWDQLIAAAEKCGWPQAAQKPGRKNKRQRVEYVKPGMAGRTKLT